MSLIYTEGFLTSEIISSLEQDLEKNIKNILIVPPRNNTNQIILYIYDYDIYHPVKKIYLLNNSVYLTGDEFERNHVYKIATNGDNVQIYYEKEALTNE